VTIGRANDRYLTIRARTVRTQKSSWCVRVSWVAISGDPVAVLVWSGDYQSPIRRRLDLCGDLHGRPGTVLRHRHWPFVQTRYSSEAIDNEGDEYWQWSPKHRISGDIQMYCGVQHRGIACA